MLAGHKRRLRSNGGASLAGVVGVSTTCPLVYVKWSVLLWTERSVAQSGRYCNGTREAFVSNRLAFRPYRFPLSAFACRNPGGPNCL